MNNGHNTGYFKCSRGACQGDPLSAYLFILAIEGESLWFNSFIQISNQSVFMKSLA